MSATERPERPSRARRAFYAIPVIGWIARDLAEGSRDNIYYLLVALLGPARARAAGAGAGARDRGDARSAHGRALTPQPRRFALGQRRGFALPLTSKGARP
jgi:hypothetical protein